MKPVTAWILLSAHGYPALVYGISFTRKQLLETYLRNFGHSAQTAGLKAVRVKLKLLC